MFTGDASAQLARGLNPPSDATKSVGEGVELFKQDPASALPCLAALARRCRYKSRELAQALGITQRHLQRLFAAQLGRGPQEWLNEQRLIVAGQMLLEARAVKEVAYQLGFPSASQLSRDFRNHFGVKPSTLLGSRGRVARA